MYVKVIHEFMQVENSVPINTMFDTLLYNKENVSFNRKSLSKIKYFTDDNT
jgi:hypothetical protein